jgi:DNA-binding GntR family transcriptional regulator
MSEIAFETLEQLFDGKVSRSDYPKYLRVFDAFADGIRSGHFKPGQRIPAETTLCERLPVSLGTVQKAMSKLASSGLVVRNRKSGTFIADRSSQATEAFVFRFKDPATGKLLLPFVRALNVTEDTFPGPWSEAFGESRCIRLDRLLWIDQDPPAYASVYFTYQHGRELLNVPVEQLHGSSTHRILMDKFKLPTLRLEHRIGCRELAPQACEYLLVPKGTIGTVWDVCDFSIQNKPSLFQRLQIAPGHRPLEISETVQG